MPAALRKFRDNLPPPAATALAHIGSLAAGLCAAFVLHYLVYRMGLPGTPFIYVSF